MKQLLSLTYLTLALSLNALCQDLKLPIQNNGKWGLINQYGQVLIEPKYGKITVEKSIVKLTSITGDSIGILNNNLNINWFTKIYEVTNWNATIVYNKPNSNLTFKLFGKERTTKYDKYITALDSMNAIVAINNKQGIIDSNLNEILPCIHTKIIKYFNCYLGQIPNKQIVYDLAGNAVTELEPNLKLYNKWWPLLIVESDDGNLQLINPENGISTQTPFKDIHPLFDDFYRLLSTDTDYIFNTTTGLVFKLEKHLSIEPYGPAYKVRDRYKSGLLHLDGSKWVEPIYNDVRLSSEYIFLLNRDGWGLSELDGTQILNCKYEEINLLENDVLQIKRKGKFGFCTTKGKMIIYPKYEKSWVYGTLIKCAQDKSMVLYELGGDGSKDSMVFNNTINARPEEQKETKRNLISSKDTLTVGSNKFCFYYSEQYGAYFEYKNGKRKNAQKYASIEPLGDSTHIIIKRNAFKKTAKFTFDEEYKINHRVGVYSKSCRKIIKPIVVAIDRVELATKDQNNFRALNNKGEMYLESKGYTPKVYCTFIDTCHASGQRRYNIGGQIVISDSITENTVCTRLEFKQRFGLLQGEKPFNSASLSKQHINIIGGKWGVINHYGSFASKSKQLQLFDGVEYGNKDYFIIKNNNAISLQTFDKINESKSRILYPYKSVVPISVEADNYFLVNPYDSFYGYINHLGQYTKYPVYKMASNFSNGKSTLSNYNGPFIQDSQLNLTGTYYNEVSPYYKESATAITADNFHHIINAKGEKISQGQYFNIKPFTDTITWAVKKGGWIPINRSGNEIGSKTFERTTPFKNGYAFATKNRSKNYQLINSAGTIISKKRYRVITDFNKKGIAKVKTKKHQFYIDTLGKSIYKGRYSELSNQYLNKAAAQKKSKFYIIDKSGNKLLLNESYTYNLSINDGLIMCKKGAKYGFVNLKGETVVEPIYEKAHRFSENKAFVLLNKQLICIDTLGQVLFMLDGELHKTYSNGFAIIKNGKGYQYIDHDGKPFSKYYFENARPFKNGRAKVFLNGRANLLLSNGKLINPDGFLNVNNTNSKNLLVTEWSGMGLLKSDLTDLLPSIYTNITPITSHIFRVDHFDNTFYYDIVRKGWLWHHTEPLLNITSAAD